MAIRVPLPRGGRSQLATGCVLLLGAGSAAAVALGAGSSGDLDTSFGSGGVQLVRGLDDSNDVALAILPDGRLQTGGRERALRFTADGQPDQSFGVGGIVPIPDSATTDLKNASGVAVDAQGRTLIAGSYQPGGGGNRTALLRLLPDGSPDPSFGGADGIVDVDISSTTFQSESGESVLVQPDGKYVVIGTVDSDANERPTVLRLNANGTPDTGFAGDGSLVYGSVGMEAVDGVLTPAGDLLVSGYDKGASDTAVRAAVVARVKTNGTLDTTFGTGGLARSAAVAGLAATDVVVLPDGRIRQLASASPPADTGAARGYLSGYTATGAPDTAVGPGGQRAYDLSPGAGTLLSAMTVAGDRLWVAGSRNIRNEGPTTIRSESLVARLSADGAPDPSFSGDGFAGRDEGTVLGIPTAIRVDAAGKPVTAGFAFTDIAAGKSSTRLARYLAADEPAPAPPATTTVTTTTPGRTVTVTVPTPPVVPKTPSAASVLRLPSSARCLTRKSVRLTVVKPTGLTVRKVTAKAGTAKAKTVRPPVSIALAGRPKAKVKVLVTATLSSGVTLKRTVTYTLCARKR